MTPQRAYVSQFTVQLGLLSVVVELVPVKATEDKTQSTSLVSICPDCKQPVHQFYECDQKHAQYTVGQLAKAKETAQGLVPLTPDEVKAISEADGPVGILDLNVAKGEELFGSTILTGSAYRLRPAKKAPPGAYALLKALVEEPDTALYGMARLNSRAQAQPYVLILHRGQVVMAQIVKPTAMAPVDELGELTVDPKNLALARQLLASMVKPVDNEVFENRRLAKLGELIEGRTPVLTEPVQHQTAGLVDLVAQLQASLAQAKAKKAPTRKNVPHPDDELFSEEPRPRRSRRKAA